MIRNLIFALVSCYSISAFALINVYWDDSWVREFTINRNCTETHFADMYDEWLSTSVTGPYRSVIRNSCRFKISVPQGRSVSIKITPLSSQIIDDVYTGQVDEFVILNVKDESGTRTKFPVHERGTYLATFTRDTELIAFVTTAFAGLSARITFQITASGYANTVNPGGSSGSAAGAPSIALKSEYTTNTDGSFKLNLGKLITSSSTPKLSVKGLPSGLKYDRKTQTIQGTAKKPGKSKVSVTLSNASVKKGITKTFYITVPNLTAANNYFIYGLQNNNADKYEILVGASDFSETLPNLAVKYGTLSVKGLPSGLKYDRYTGCITGTAKKAGVYTATLTVTNGKQKSISTITIDVKPLPSWAVGTFEICQHVYGQDGSTGNDCWDAVSGGYLKISSSGVISGRLMELGKTVKNLNWKNLKIVGLNKDGFVVLRSSSSISSKEIWNLEFEIFPREVNGVTVGTIIGVSFGRDEDADSYDGDFYGVQNVWKMPERSYFPSFVNGTRVTIDMKDFKDEYRNFEEGEFPYTYGGYLTLNFKPKGAVLAQYSDSMGGRVLAKHSTVLVPDISGENGELGAFVVVSIKPVAGREGFDLLLWLSLDHSNGLVGSDDITITGQDFNFDWN